jgi:hypothetical protein
MSNIFYTEVDPNLQTELNARGKSGYARDNRSLNFMLGKVANVQVTAYAGSGSNDEILYILAGSGSRSGRFMPDQFLTPQNYEQSLVKFYQSTEQNDFKNAAAAGQNPVVGEAYASTNTFLDNSRRVAPYVTDVTINIGDHSYGLLNKASIDIVIPNVQRDLDVIEDIFFRPGRYVDIDVVHPESAIISVDKQENGILLKENILPKDKKLKELYPGKVAEELEKLKTEARKMNQFKFRGLITNFNFSYTSDATVNAKIDLTGTSDVYTDLSMFTNSEDSKNEADQPKNYITVESGPIIETKTAVTGANYTSQFYESLYEYVDNTIAKTILQTAAEEGVEGIDSNQIREAQLNNKLTDLLESLDSTVSENLPKSVLTKIITNNNQQNTEIATDNWILKGDPWNNNPSNKKTVIPLLPSLQDLRYITLGGLISYINDKILRAKTDENGVSTVIVCSDAACTSNYYNNLVSTDPKQILLLPQNPDTDFDMNSYGDLVWYNSIITDAAGLTEEWPGVYETSTSADGVEQTDIYPSRIFINLSVIKEIIYKISNEGRSSYNVKTFLASISSEIMVHTGHAIELKLVTHPSFQTQLLFNDAKNIKPIVEPEKPYANVRPYSVPMFANHPNGTICHNFSLNSQLPSNAKNLAYVLNTSKEISESDIAPFLNFMYQAGTGQVDAINNFIRQYKQKHIDLLETLNQARSNYGDDPESAESSKQLQGALFNYLKYPTDNIFDAQAQQAPTFPFECNFVIDGINGFRYGDVLQFDALPKRYRFNTVFSIIGLTHTINTKGFWTTDVKCIMRPRIGDADE